MEDFGFVWDRLRRRNREPQTWGASFVLCFQFCIKDLQCYVWKPVWVVFYELTNYDWDTTVQRTLTKAHFHVRVISLSSLYPGHP